VRLSIAFVAALFVALDAGCNSSSDCPNGDCSQSSPCMDGNGQCADAAIQTGNPCNGPSDCDPAALCAFPIADGCNAKGVCVADSPPCTAPPAIACACDGTPIGLSCIYGPGRAAAPLKSMSPCGSPDGGASDAAADASGDVAQE
jgi:hypothetical protein